MERVVQGSGGKTVAESVRRGVDRRIAERSRENRARRLQYCSVCEQPTPRESLDSSARCNQCTP